MAKYIDADRLKEAIFKKYKTDIEPLLAWVGERAIFDHVIPTIDDLQQEQPEVDLEKPVPDDLDKAAEEATIKEGILAGPNFEVAVRTFKAGVKWRDSHFPKLPDDLDKAARKSAVAPFNFDLDEEHLYEYPYLPIAEQKFKEGAKWQKEQMMNGAIPCKVFWHDGPLLDYTQEQQDNALERIGANVGDKVKIIIVKED